MKYLISVIFIVSLIFGSSGCKSTFHFKAPPGQVKKQTGTKSAKPFAPGQQKKKKKNNRNNQLELLP